MPYLSGFLASLSYAPGAGASDDLNIYLEQFGTLL